MFSIVSDAFSDIGVSLNIDKCEFLPYSCTTATPFQRNNFTVPLVDCIIWLGIYITNNLSSLCQRTVCDFLQQKLLQTEESIIDCAGQTLFYFL